jgi:hypothetical protein
MCVARLGVTTTIYKATDEADNTEVFNLTTVVVDELAPRMTYKSKYNMSWTTQSKLNRMIELVEASLQEDYMFGQLSAIDPPFETVSNISLASMKPVNRSMFAPYLSLVCDAPLRCVW